MPTLPNSVSSLLVRTVLSNDDEWQRLVLAVGTDSDDGASVLFIADGGAISDPEFPILCVSVRDSDVAPFRCIASELWSVDNNINLANMDWDDYASSTIGGVFRGFE